MLRSPSRSLEPGSLGRQRHARPLVVAATHALPQHWTNPDRVDLPTEVLGLLQSLVEQKTVLAKREGVMLTVSDGTVSRD